MSRTTDNRNMDDMDNYQEARIEFLKRRVKELEAENAELIRLSLERWQTVNYSIER